MYPFGTLTWFCLLGSLGRALCSLAVGLALGIAQSPWHRVGPQKPYYIRHNLYITTSGVCDFSPLLCALLALSSDNILFAADYPFEDLNTATAFLRSAPISEDDRAKIAHGNTQRLLHLQARVARRAFDELTDAGHLLRCMSPEVAPLRHAD